MIKKTALTALVAAFTAFTIAASDLSNHDTADHKVTVKIGDVSKVITIKAGETLTNICTECVLFLEGSTEGFDVYEDEKVYIKDGKFHIMEE